MSWRAAATAAREATREARVSLPAARRPRRRGFATFAGLRDPATLTTSPTFQKAAGPIPVLRLVDEEGRLVDGAELPFSLEEAVDMHKTMLRVSVVDQILSSLQRQGRISFYMTGTGEEAAQVGTSFALGPRDVMWPQYRELGALMQRGYTVEQVVDQCMGRGSDPGKGRQMPVHYCDAERSIQCITSPLGTQIPQAVGAGYAFRVGGDPRCGVAYFGDGAASEGDFAVGLNFAATLRAQTMFICRNNGWAISTPAKEQYAGDGIAARAIAYGMQCIRADGNDLAAVVLATRQARDLCLAGEPVVVELMTYRRGHHSTSDDASRYRPGTEVKSMARAGLEPISRMRIVLEREGQWDDAQEEALRESTRGEVMNALKQSEAKKFYPVRDMFEDVWARPTPQLQRQRAELEEHMARHAPAFAKSLERFQC